MSLSRTFAIILALTAGCSQSTEPPGARPLFDLGAAEDGAFFNFPFPSDLRLDADGTINLAGYPRPIRGDLFGSLIEIADARRGFSTLPVAYFRFAEALADLQISNVIPASPSSPILLIDVDPDSPNRGALLPAVASTLPTRSPWTPGHLLAVAPFPGVVLQANHQYAIVVTTDVRGEDGRPILRAKPIAALSQGKAPSGYRGSDIEANLAPVWEALDIANVDRQRVATTAVFTTSDVVADLSAVAAKAASRYQVTIENLKVDEDDGTSHADFCELNATISMPQFQAGEPPFHTKGLIEYDNEGLPIAQRNEEVAVVLTVPKTAMPSGGFPLMIYSHGSGGVPAQLVDRGRKTPENPTPVGTGPAMVVAKHGIASVAAAMPLSPARLPGASEIEYLNFANLGAFPGTFHQGVIEQRLLLDAILDLEIPPDLLTSCGFEATSNTTFDQTKVVMSGQSMGGMYTNMVAATDERVAAAVPTGAGGFWHRMLLGTEIIPNADELLALVLDTDVDDLTFTHPGLGLLALAWESAEPVVFMPRIAARPLPGHPARPSYQPIGYGDEYFPTYIFDSAVMAFRNQLAGEAIWTDTDDSLDLIGIQPRIEYPVRGNRTSADGTSYTGVAVQYLDDGIMNAHYIFAQLDEVKYQYGCFLATFIEGAPTVPAPAALGTPCPIK